ncbi:hypothetical protein L0657_12505 [Dyadobacter sp. CY345]|uniref:hypothetical protein n=1 Tax=Dyadobacter sp. CY345 TaxID=2909335 RepID=UPI001F236455|nr:hypothetical protein [Dyadobacter sp. CY345]MCF2444781.1 hypothetical protein [Dyadobacter sp. CY345]
MKKGFKIVELPGLKSRKVAGIKQQGHRTANLKRYETPDKNLTVRFFCNISSAFFTLRNSFHSSEYILEKSPENMFDVSSDPETRSSFKLKLQNAALKNLGGLTYLSVKSNNDYAAMHFIAQILAENMFAAKGVIKSKKQIKWLSI